MTTDTVPKAFGAQVMIDGVPVSITGISKGAGMIRPNMATMLGFMATDACVSPGADEATGARNWPKARSTASRSMATPRPMTPLW